MTLGKRLRNLREQLNQSQTYVSKMLKITPQAYSQYERDIRMPDAVMLQKLSNYYNVSIDYLLDKQDDSYLHPSDDLKPKATPEQKKKLADDIMQLLEDKGIVQPGQDLTREQLEWLKKLIDQAVDITRMGRE
ncbi:helix-turn-helix domain-containing protein [Anaerotalea alkaliphila]|uniref:Helix-turn-helix transcriptional regulator n=1 Tax=Anaerotalea alkaliphila TaxID=2662126 RepID=A0A7X5HXL6_9FIRM|nr:helix-turn-helix transcriptional regulator [Anaerotalea alkaliphila]NDL68483.1 helix-turn-helix transcriptional regulator [Anaerotalea alkaliphila]